MVTSDGFETKMASFRVAVCRNIRRTKTFWTGWGPNFQYTFLHELWSSSRYVNIRGWLTIKIVYCHPHIHEHMFDETKKWGLKRPHYFLLLLCGREPRKVLVHSTKKGQCHGPQCFCPTYGWTNSPSEAQRTEPFCNFLWPHIQISVGLIKLNELVCHGPLQLHMN